MRSHLVSLAIVAAAMLAIPPAGAQQLPEESVELDCDPGFGALRALYRADIEAIDASYSFSIWEVCPDRPDPALRQAGNAGGLHGIIAGNAPFAAALAEEGYVADDVVAVRFGPNNSVIVYVHKVN